MVRASEGMQSMDFRRGGGDRDSNGQKMRSFRIGEDVAQKEFEKFAAGSAGTSAQLTGDDLLENFDFEYFMIAVDTPRDQHVATRPTKKAFKKSARARQPKVTFDGELESEDALANFDIDKFLSDDPPSASKPFDNTWPIQRANEQCAEASAHALPAEVRSLALERLRQIEGHMAIRGALLSQAGEAEAQRRMELENEWLLWWEESPTGCFDDSRDYFAYEGQSSYADAWERHLSDAPSVAKGYMRQSVLQEILPTVPQPAMPLRSPLPELSQVRAREGAGRGCPNRRSHEDLTACGRSTPIAAQHRSCPHAGCEYCSTSSTGWFQHVRACAV